MSRGSLTKSTEYPLILNGMCPTFVNVLQFQKPIDDGRPRVRLQGILAAEGLEVFLSDNYRGMPEKCLDPVEVPGGAYGDSVGTRSSQEKTKRRKRRTKAKPGV